MIFVIFYLTNYIQHGHLRTSKIFIYHVHLFTNKMRLLIAGNLANTGYYLASKLRSNGIECDLLLGKNSPFGSDPKETGEIKNNIYPDWIKFWDNKKGWKRTILRIMRQYDLICASTELPIFALFSGKPYVALATGSDLVRLAQSFSLKGVLLRLAYKRAKIVIHTLPSQIEYANKLKLKNALFLPLFRDFKKPTLENKIVNVNNRFVFFHPTNHIWDIKANDVFLRAYIRLCATRDDVHLILINRGIDAKKSIDLLKNAGIEGKYEILPQSLNQDELLQYYQNCQAIADQFKLGSFGFIGLEVMSLKKPLICYIDGDLYERCYGEKPPALSSKNEEEIYEILKKLVDDKEFYNNISNKSYEWIIKFHLGEILIKKYMTLYELVHKKASFEEIKSDLKF